MITSDDSSPSWFGFGSFLIFCFFMSIIIKPSHVGLTSVNLSPFNGSARLEYSLKSNTTVSLKVINTNGRLVSTLVNEEQSAGNHSVIWDASNQPTGVYLVTLNACGVTETVKMIHFK